MSWNLGILNSTRFLDEPFLVQEKIECISCICSRIFVLTTAYSIFFGYINGVAIQSFVLIRILIHSSLAKQTCDSEFVDCQNL